MEDFLITLVSLVFGFMFGWYHLPDFTRKRRPVTTPSPWLKLSYQKIIAAEMDIYGHTYHSESGEYVTPYKAILVHSSSGDWWAVDERAELRAHIMEQQARARAKKEGRKYVAGGLIL